VIRADTGPGRSGCGAHHAVDNKGGAHEAADDRATLQKVTPGEASVALRSPRASSNTVGLPLRLPSFSLMTGTDTLSRGGPFI